MAYRLAHPWPRRLLGDARARVEAALATDGAGCGGWECQGTEASLVQRRIANGVMVVCLQCDWCGRTMAGPFKRADHPDWADYHLWDDDLIAGRETARAEAFEARRIVWQERQHPERTAAYAEFLLTQPWRELRALVLTRAGGRCEACLRHRAVQVHHTTYDLGWLPPAYCLVAVCQACHDRLHAGWEPPSEPPPF